MSAPGAAKPVGAAQPVGSAPRITPAAAGGGFQAAWAAARSGAIGAGAR